MFGSLFPLSIFIHDYQQYLEYVNTCWSAEHLTSVQLCIKGQNYNKVLLFILQQMSQSLTGFIEINMICFVNQFSWNVI